MIIESVSCFGVTDNESLLLVTTDKRELYVYYRNNHQVEWQCILQTLSPHPDIYYTCTGCLPLLDCPEGATVSEPTVLLFLCGTDHHIYVNQLSIKTKVMQPLCVLTVTTTFKLICRVLRIGLHPSVSIVVLLNRIKSPSGV